jgi:hypothetical protein
MTSSGLLGQVGTEKAPGTGGMICDCPATYPPPGGGITSIRYSPPLGQAGSLKLTSNL